MKPNTYYYNQTEEYLPNYYYRSPFQEQQFFLYQHKTPVKEEACQTKSPLMYVEKVLESNELQQQKDQEDLEKLIDADLSIIEQQKKDQFQPYGRICLPSLMIYVNNCRLSIVYAKLGRLKSSIVLVPYLEGQISSYIGVLFKRKTLESIESQLKAAKKQQGSVVYMTSTYKTKFELFAFVRLNYLQKKCFLAGASNLLLTASTVQNVGNSKLREILIPYQSRYNCGKELIQKILDYVEAQRDCFFTRIAISCQHIEDFQQLSSYFNELVKIYHFKQQLIA